MVAFLSNEVHPGRRYRRRARPCTDPEEARLREIIEGQRIELRKVRRERGAASLRRHGELIALRALKARHERELLKLRTQVRMLRIERYMALVHPGQRVQISTMERQAA